jgi:3-oxoacyl-[acyl-carrier protein] reductase
MNNEVLILGASSDIGIETVKVFLSKNWKVIAHYNSSPKSLKILQNENRNKIKLIKINFKDIEKANKEIIKNKKILANVNSFVSLVGYLKPKSSKKINFRNIIDHIKINYFSNIIIMEAIKKTMLKKNFARILLSSSIGTKFGGGEATYAYSISKFLNEFIPSEFKKKYANKIIYNVLQIGVTKTKIHNKIKRKNMKKRTRLIPIQRMANSKEVANKIFFLSSEKNTLIHGQIINISGGE